MRTVWGLVLMWGSIALAAPSTVTIAGGDCRNPELITATQSFGLGVAEKAQSQIITSEAVLERFRPLPTVSAEDLGRQLETAQAQFYAGTYDKALEGLNQSLAGIARLSPRADPWKLMSRALMLQSMVLKSAGKKNEANEAQKRILRIEPQLKLDADYYTPATIQAFDALRKDVAKSKRAKLTITSTPNGAQVFLDGALVGKTPFAGEFPVGSYRLSLASGDRLSFGRDLTLSRAEAIQVDLAFEGALAPQAPLCVNAEPAQLLDTALRLAALAGADTVAVLRLDARNNEPGWVTAILLEVNKGTKVREGGVRFTGPKRGQAVRDLAGFVHTGNPTGAVVTTLGANVGAPAAAPAPVTVAEPEAATAPAPPAPVVAEARSSGGRGLLPRISSFALVGAGLIAGGIGLGLYATGGADRAALAAMLDDQGRLRPGVKPDDAKATAARVDGANTTGLALGAAGGAAILVGAAVFFLLPPSEAGSVAVVPTRDGVWAGAAFSF